MPWRLFVKHSREGGEARVRTDLSSSFDVRSLDLPIALTGQQLPDMRRLPVMIEMLRSYNIVYKYA